MDIYEYFASLFHCFISDLRLQNFDSWNSRADVIRNIPETQFSLSDWNEFLSYLYLKPFSLSSIEEAKNYLLTAHPNVMPEGTAYL